MDASKAKYLRTRSLILAWSSLYPAGNTVSFPRDTVLSREGVLPAACVHEILWRAGNMAHFRQGWVVSQ